MKATRKKQKTKANTRKRTCVSLKEQAPVVQGVDIAAQWISAVQTNQAFHWIVIYPMDGVLAFEQPRSGVLFVYQLESFSSK